METSKMILIVVVLVFVVVCLMKWVIKAYHGRKMDALYEAFGLQDREEVFADSKEEFCFVGTMLRQAFPKGDLETLVGKYINLYKTYTALKGDVYRALNYEKNHSKDFKEDDFYTMVALVMLNVDGLKTYEDDSAERIEPFRKKAMARVKTIETIANDQTILGIKPEKRLGDRYNAILVAGVSGIEEYLGSIVAEDGTELKYVHKSTLYISDKELEIDYDLRKYSLRDAATDAEMCSLWFNVYGTENCETCIEGYMFAKDALDVQGAFVQDKRVENTNQLEVPSNVDVINIPSTGRPKVVWAEVEGANKYFIYRSRGKEEVFVYLGSSVDTAYIDLSADVGSRYFYKVKAADTTNKSAQSELSDFKYTVCDLPRPVVTAGTDEETGKVKLTWTPVDEAVTYEIHRSTSADGEYKKMYTHKRTEYVNTGLVEPGMTYYYKVRAIHSNSYANSAFSEVVSGCWNPPEETANTSTDEKDNSLI